MLTSYVLRLERYVYYFVSSHIYGYLYGLSIHLLISSCTKNQINLNIKSKKKKKLNQRAKRSNDTQQIYMNHTKGESNY